MSQRQDIEELLKRLYTARAGGDLEGVCACFSDTAAFRISGASSTSSPTTMRAAGSTEVRRLLSLMVKSFKLTEFQILSMIIDGTRAAVHWRADVHSRISGTIVATEMVDVVEVAAGRISSYVEIYVPQ